MRADQAVRHNAAVGALIGLAVADAVSGDAEAPPVICEGAVSLSAWGAIAERAFVCAEALLQGHPLDMDLTAAGVVGAAIGLCATNASPPLLVDPDAAYMCNAVRDGLLGYLDLEATGAHGPDLSQALATVRASSSYTDAVSSSCRARCSPEATALTGALAGMLWGPAAVPATWATTTHGPVGPRTYRLRQLRRLAERLMQFDAPMPPEPRRSLGPREVAPNLWLSNLHAVPRFVADHPDGAVISLCPTTGAFDNHALRREFALHDASGSRVNPRLSMIVDEVLDTIRVFHEAGRDVLVHCHHGASRTGLILRSWLVEELALSYEDATSEAQVRWPKTSTWNQAYSAEVRRRADQ